MQQVKLGILGLGTVGSGVVNILNKNQAELMRRVGTKFVIAAACVKDLDKPRNCNCEFELTKDPNLLINNPSIEVIVEAIGGIDLAKELIIKAIKNQKQIITANKALIAEYGGELFLLAEEYNTKIYYEASTCGGIPIIKTLKESLAANQIEYIAGIINGTSNYILSKMHQNNLSFQAALEQAQANGFAESDPSFDINGKDSAHKLTILSALGFGAQLAFDKVYIEGIEQIQAQDVYYAQKLGYVIKHLGIANLISDKLALRAHPCLVNNKNMLSKVDSQKNAIIIKGDALGETMYYGPGAGSLETASSIVADLVDIARSNKDSVPHFGFLPEKLLNPEYMSISDLDYSYYLRLMVNNKPGILAKISNILSEKDISIASILQHKPYKNLDSRVPIIILTYSTKEKIINNAIENINKLDDVSPQIIKLRIYNNESD